MISAAEKSVSVCMGIERFPGSALAWPRAPRWEGGVGRRWGAAGRRGGGREGRRTPAQWRRWSGPGAGEALGSKKILVRRASHWKNQLALLAGAPPQRSTISVVQILDAVMLLLQDPGGVVG